MQAHIQQWHVQRSMNLSSSAPGSLLLPALSLQCLMAGVKAIGHLSAQAPAWWARGRHDQAFSGCLCAQAEQALCSRSPCSRELTKLAANSKYKVSLQFPASRETQAPRTMDTCQTIAVIQGHFGSPNWSLLAPVLSALPSARSTGSRS